MWKEFFQVSKSKGSSHSLAVTTDSLLWLFRVDFEESFEHLLCSCKLCLARYCSTSKAKTSVTALNSVV